jgi:hypothetical protein
VTGVPDLRIDALRGHRGTRGKYDHVEVVVPDLESLRALRVVPGVRARTVEVRTEEGAVLATRTTDIAGTRVGVHDVVAELGRQVVWPAALPPAGLGTERIDLSVHNPVGLVLDDSPVPALDDLDAGQVARLALQGAPLTAARVPAELAAELGPEVTAAITAPLAPDDPRAREEHSIVLRRAAFDRFVEPHHQQSVSILMATRRPDMVDHALSQVARQRGVRQLELVLALHGFDVDPARVPAAAGDASVRLAPQGSDAVFGDVLNAAAAAAGGEVVLKMDDDDWYSPDFVADLLRARVYSGADLVGAPDDLYYLEDRDLTLSLGHRGEVFRGFVAGGSMLLERGTLRWAGGFRPVPRHVDAALIEDVRAAGGTVFRTHGFGYVTRRTASGHTWDADLDDLVARAVQTWPGFRPGRLMEL